MNRGPYASDRAAWCMAGKENRRRKRNNDPDRVTVVELEGLHFVVECEKGASQ